MRIKENNEENTVDFAELESGECFRYQRDLWVKTDYEQDAVCLQDGNVRADMCGEQITPINAEVQIID